VDQRIDRAQADSLQPVLQPVRRWPVLDAANQASGENRAGVFSTRREFQLDADGAFELALHRREIALTQTSEARRREIARDTVDAAAIRAVRRDRDLDDGIIAAQNFSRRRANL